MHQRLFPGGSELISKSDKRYKTPEDLGEVSRAALEAVEGPGRDGHYGSASFVRGKCTQGIKAIFTYYRGAGSGTILRVGRSNVAGIPNLRPVFITEPS